jgi:hypothetical protein
MVLIKARTISKRAVFGCLGAVYLAKIDGGTTVRLNELSPGFAGLTGTWRSGLSSLAHDINSVNHA